MPKDIGVPVMLNTNKYIHSVMNNSNETRYLVHIHGDVHSEDMDKLMLDGGGNVIVTNDGATILRELDVSHPGGKMIVEVAKTQENLCYDGTTSTVILAGQLLANSEALFER